MTSRPIPIRNIFYLFLYAWDCFPAGRRVAAGIEDSPDLPNLLARVLIKGVRQLLRGGLDRCYLEQIEGLRAPRGRFLLTPSIAQASLLRRRLVCAYDELLPDVPHNRILKATMRWLATQKMLQRCLADELNVLSQRFTGVVDIPLSPELFRRVQLSRHSSRYDLLLRICVMARETLMPVAGGTGSGFAALLDDEIRMSTIFEAFVRNFFKQEQGAYHVSTAEVSWDTIDLQPNAAQYLPTMRTDVMLRSATHTIIIDAKFYKETFQSFRGGSPRIRSAHLYQLMTYLAHEQRTDGNSRPVEGLLLYPSVDGREVRLLYTLAGHRVRLWTIDLAQPWQHVHEQLLGLIGTNILGNATEHSSSIANSDAAAASA